MQHKFHKTENYSPSDDSIFVADQIKNEKGICALDIGTGTGFLANVLMPNFELVVATDISFFALKEAHSIIENCVCCNAADAINKRFDLVVCNMPYLPSEQIEDNAVDGLGEGIEIPLRIIQSVKNIISKNGRFIFLTSTHANFQEIIKQTELMGFNTKIITKKKLFFEELILVEARNNSIF